mgnify:CR=1 FL=1
MTAEQYLATLPQQEQQQVRNSLATSGSTIDQWFQAAIDAGDPRAVGAAGGRNADYGGNIADPSGAAPSSEWLGKRAPTPRELRRYYSESGKSDDLGRFDDRQLAAWLKDNWNVQGGYFTNDFGDVVEKPTESGPQSQAAGFATGEGPAHGGGRGGGGGAGGASVAGGKAFVPTGAPVSSAYDQLSNPLQAELYRLYGGRAGYFGQPGQSDTTRGTSLAGGGIWWSDPGKPAGTAAAPAGTGGFEPLPTGQPQISPPRPQAAPAAASAWQPWSAGSAAQPTVGGRPGLRVPPPVKGPLETALASGPYRDSNRWWMPQTR